MVEGEFHEGVVALALQLGADVRAVRLNRAEADEECFDDQLENEPLGRGQVVEPGPRPAPAVLARSGRRSWPGWRSNLRRPPP
jgi:hypothetical protein